MEPPVERVRAEAAGTLIDLMAAALHGRRIADEAANLTPELWRAIYQLSRFHAVQAPTFRALPEHARMCMDERVWRQWSDESDLTLFQQIGYDQERTAILKDFYKAGLSWLPLKGIDTATYYPAAGLRSMGDQDLLVGFTERQPTDEWQARGRNGGEDMARQWEREADETIAGIMQAHGYAQKADADRERIWERGTFRFEMHRALVSRLELSNGTYGEAIYRHYANPWRLAEPADEGAGAFAWKPEDAYVFHVAHMFKHYSSAGFGIRFLADEYVLMQRFGNTMDWTRVHGELAGLALADFERGVRSLAVALFSSAEGWRSRLDQDDALLLEELMDCGIYGTQRRRFARRIDRVTAEGDECGRDGGRGGMRKRQALAYIRARIMPTREWYEAFHPRWAGNALTRGIFAIWRLSKSILVKPRAVALELRVLGTHMARNDMRAEEPRAAQTTGKTEPYHPRNKE